jgi:hypothetical protein
MTSFIRGQNDALGKQVIYGPMRVTGRVGVDRGNKHQ